MTAPARPAVELHLPVRSPGLAHVEALAVVEQVMSALVVAGWEPALHCCESISLAIESAEGLLSAFSVQSQPPVMVGAELLQACQHPGTLPGDLPCGTFVTLGLDPTGAVVAICPFGHVRWVAEDRTDDRG